MALALVRQSDTQSLARQARSVDHLKRAASHSCASCSRAIPGLKQCIQLSRHRPSAGPALKHSGWHPPSLRLTAERHRQHTEQAVTPLRSLFRRLQWLQQAALVCKRQRSVVSQMMAMPRRIHLFRSPQVRRKSGAIKLSARLHVRYNGTRSIGESSLVSCSCTA